MTTQEKTIELVDIEVELKKLWDEQLGQNRIHAAFFTLIIYTTKLDKNPQYQKLIQTVISKFPCRVIWIKEEKNGHQYLKTKVRTEVVSSNIFCEIIEIEGSGGYVERIPYIALPHILSDLPLYLLWTEEPAIANPMFSFFAPLSRKIILDTALVEDLNKYAKGALQLVNQYPEKISDLSWNTLRGWRRLFDSIFNTKQELAMLNESSEFTIAYHYSPKSRNNQINAVYFQAWLALVLQWNFVKIENDKKSSRITYKSSREEVIVSLIPDANPDFATLFPGALISIEVEGGPNHAHYRFKRNCETRQIFCQFSDKDCCELPHCHYLPGISEGQEIIEEIFFPTENQVYRKILNRVAEISWAIE